MENFLINYELSGTFLLLGGIVLNVVPLAMFLKKPSWMRNSCKNKASPTKKLNKSQKNCEINSKAGETPLNYDNKAFCTEEDLPENRKTVFCNVTITNKVLNNVIERERSSSLNSIRGRLESQQNDTSGTLGTQKRNPDFEILNEVIEYHQLEKELKNEKNSENCSNLNNRNYHEEIPGRSAEQSNALRYRRTSSCIERLTVEISNKIRSSSFASQCAQDGFVSCIEFDESHKNSDDVESANVAQHLDEVNPSSSFSVIDNLKTKEADSPQEPQDTSENKTKARVPSEDSVLKLFFRTNSKPIFILISITLATYVYLFVALVTIIIDYATDQGVPQEQSKYLIIGFSFTDLIGRLSFGQVIDRNLMKMKNYTSVLMVLMGTLVCVIPLNRSFNYMMVLLCLIGWIQGGTAIMYPILINKYMKKNEESISMGSMNLYGGILMLTMAPMIGYFRDQIGSYNGVFYIVGGMAAVMGLFWQAEHLFLRSGRHRHPRT